ncbi:MAG: MBOAT family protein [Verrucomicrobia bacterium]|nr:MBOAT family protein [Verrucomicrobiota bacterium]
MSFISWSFVVLFALVFAARLAFSRRNTGAPYLLILLAASVVFYGWHVPWYLLLLVFSSAVDYFAALWIDRSPAGSARRKWLIAACVSANLGLLAVFKYWNFGLSTLESLLEMAGVPAKLPHSNLILPMGLSFYTFVAMGYAVDVYRGKIPPERSFWKLFLFISFFPHLMAGPVIRAKDFLHQLYRKRRVCAPVFYEGMWLIIQGAFLKLVCANNLANTVDRLWNAQTIAQAGSADLAAMALMYSGQIFCDFAGYSNMARGMAYLLGFRFPVNFNNPYIAASFSNFWQRWHITLSTWLRDYFYISLGGNRISPRRTYINLIVVMVLGGLWHGAAATYVVWGAIHGAALAGERLLGLGQTGEQSRGRAAKLAWLVVVQVVVLVAWVFFRSPGLHEAVNFLKRILHWEGSFLPSPALLQMMVFLVPPAIMHLRGALVERGLVPPMGRFEQAALAGALLFLTMIGYGINNAFIYFQF